MEKYSGGIGIPGLLGILFVALKLLGKIDWPWIWVLSPFWIPIGVVIIVLLIILVFYIVAVTAR